MLVIALIALVSYDTTYTDALGAQCASFVVGQQEACACMNVP